MQKSGLSPMFHDLEVRGAAQVASARRRVRAFVDQLLGATNVEMRRILRGIFVSRPQY